MFGVRTCDGAVSAGESCPVSLHDGSLPPDWGISSVRYIPPVFWGLFHVCHHSDHHVCLLVALSWLCHISQENAVYSSHFEDGKVRENWPQKRSLVVLCLRLLSAVVLHLCSVKFESMSTSDGNPEFPQNSSAGFQARYQKQTLPVWSFPLWGIHGGHSLAGYSKHLWDFLFGKFPSSHFAILRVQYAPKFYSCLLNCL